MSENPAKKTTTRKKPAQLSDDEKCVLVEAWYYAKGEAAEAIERERQLRAELVALLFPQGLTEGSNRLELPSVVLTVTHKIERGLDEGVFDALKGHPDLAGLPFDSLVRVKRELKLREYKATLEAGSLKRSIFDTCLHIKEGAPQVKVTPNKKTQ